jgi:hypothetical protein
VRRVEVPLATVTALPDEPIFQDDGGVVILAGDGFLSVVPRASPTPGMVNPLWMPSSSMSTSARTTPAWPTTTGWTAAWRSSDASGAASSA